MFKSKKYNEEFIDEDLNRVEIEQTLEDVFDEVIAIVRNLEENDFKKLMKAVCDSYEAYNELRK